MIAFALLATLTTSGIDALAYYRGTWAIDTITGDAPGASGKRSTVTTDCWRSHAFYVCSQSTAGSPTTLVVYTTNPAHHDLYAYFVSDPVQHRTAGTELRLDGNVWTYFGKLKGPSGRYVSYRNVNRIEGSDDVDFREEYSADGKRWTLMSRGHERRLLIQRRVR